MTTSICVLLLRVFASGLYVWATEDMAYTASAGVFHESGLVQSDRAVSTGFAVHMILAAAFLIYIPFTHMTHFVGKYFTYHKVRWEDHPNIRGSKLEKTDSGSARLPDQLVGATHQDGGTWAEAATATEEVAKMSHKNKTTIKDFCRKTGQLVELDLNEVPAAAAALRQTGTAAGVQAAVGRGEEEIRIRPGRGDRRSSFPARKPRKKRGNWSDNSSPVSRNCLRKRTTGLSCSRCF